MIWAVRNPQIDGERFPNCDLLVWEQSSARPHRCHDGQLQIFMDGPRYRGRWVSWGELLWSTATWAQMHETLALATNVRGLRIVLIPAKGVSPR